MSRLGLGVGAIPGASGSVIISGLPTPPVVEQEAMIKFLITDARLMRCGYELMTWRNAPSATTISARETAAKR